jgi:GNAT superfamily N-acetyltransferase
VVLDADRVVGTFQLTYSSTLTGRGRLRARLESVQVRADRRSQGIGEQMVVFAEREARARRATTLELTSNKSRPDAHRFYERLGFGRTHEGFKKTL